MLVGTTARLTGRFAAPPPAAAATAGLDTCFGTTGFGTGAAFIGTVVGRAVKASVPPPCTPLSVPELCDR